MSDDVKEARRLVAKYPFFDHDTARRELAGWAGSGGLSRLVSKIDEMQRENERLLSLEAMQEVTRKWPRSPPMSDDVKELQLLPCPFCGGQPELCELGEDEPDNAGGWVVQCVGCQASSRVHFSVKEDARPHVISAWNARTAADKAAEVERLREKLGVIQRITAAGTRTLDEMIRDMGYANDCARAALSPPPTDSTTFPMPSVPGNHLLSGPEEG